MSIWKHYATINIFLIIARITLSSAQIVPVSNSNFNQPCLQANQCNNKAGLYCIPIGPGGQLRCGCPTNNTIFDEYQGRCVGKVGYPCIYQGNQSFCPEKAHCSHQDPHHPDLYYYESRCFCDVNYFANKQGKCLLAAKYGDSCSSTNKKCDEVSGLKCISGKCSCAFGSDQQYYDAKKDACISYIGKRCSGFHSCVDNARCDGISVSRVRTDTAVTATSASNHNLLFGGSSIVSRSVAGNGNGKSIPSDGTTSKSQDENVGVCVCGYGFTKTSTGKCLAAFRQPCSEVSPCNSENALSCLDGSCNCKSPMNQIYDHNLKRCVNLVGAKCDGKIRNSCIQNAQCINGKCQCREGYTRNPFRKCMLDYNEPCENGQCNQHNGLSCKSETKSCSCVDENLVYNPQLKACVSHVGAPCGKFLQAGDYGKESFYINCEPLTICKEEPGGDSSTMFCRLPDLK